MAKKVGLILGGIVLIALLIVGGLALTKPDEFRVERTAVVNAPPETIFAVIGDFRRSPEWSPWEKLDPNIKRTYSGPATGKGSVYAWSGNGQVGEGSMEVLEFNPPTKMVMSLNFVKPMQGKNTVEYTLEPQGEATKVTWLMYGPNDFMGKVMMVFMNCQDMCGKAFEEGLANLKRLCEKEAG